MNPTKKRAALIDHISSFLTPNLPNYRIENRVRRATISAFNRQQRIAVMGEKSEYGEVLSGTPTADLTQLNATSNPAVQAHNFIVNLWYAYSDNDDYVLSSQKIWDDNFIDGLIPHIEETNLITYEGERVFIFEPTDVTDIIVPLDGQGKELAHFLSFNLIVR